jgi:hypothetical protein
MTVIAIIPITTAAAVKAAETTATLLKKLKYSLNNAGPK